MPRWMRVIRGMIGTGLTFAAGVGAVSAILGLVALVAGQVSGRELLEMAGKLSVVAFIVGVAFSGVLAISARGRAFDKLSLRLFTALGAGVGLLYFLIIGVNNGFRVWSAGDAVGNLTFLTLLGAGLAAGTLIVARKAGHALTSGEELRRLGEGEIDMPLARREADQKTAR